MMFSTPAIILAGLASTTIATPTPMTTTTSAANPDFFVVVHSADNRVNGFCVNPYTTGKNHAVAILEECGPAPAKDFSYNITSYEVNFLGSGSNAAALVHADPGIHVNAEWGPVTMNPGTKNGTAFVHETDKGIVQKSNGFGFLACRWRHGGHWQLFALGTANPVSLHNCAHVTVHHGCYNTDAGCKDGCYE